LRCQPVIGAAGVALGHQHVKSAAHLVKRTSNVLVVHACGAVEITRKRCRAQIQTDVIRASVAQRTKTCAADIRIVVENERDRRLHSEIDGELG